MLTRCKITNNVIDTHTFITSTISFNHLYQYGIIYSTLLYYDGTSWGRAWLGVSLSTPGIHLLVSVPWFLLNGTRNPPIDTQRVNWIEHRDKLIAQGGHFRRTYRMSSESFDKLVEILWPSLTVDATRSFARNSAGPIIPEIRLQRGMMLL
jgi:hypothetical protein